MNTKFLSIFSILALLFSMALISCTSTPVESAFEKGTYESDNNVVKTTDTLGAVSYVGNANSYKLVFSADEIVFTTTPQAVTYLTDGSYDSANATVVTYTIDTETKENYTRGYDADYVPVISKVTTKVGSAPASSITYASNDIASRTAFTFSFRDRKSVV